MTTITGGGALIFPFNATEAFKIAVSLEENGYGFYTKAAEKFKGPIAQTFLGLAKEEEIHKSLFSKILASLPKQNSSVFDPDNETDQYLKMMADLHVFKRGEVDLDKLLSTIETVKDALKMAMNFEKDSVVFFVQLKSASQTEDDKRAVDSLVLEEAGHLRKLAAIYNSQ
ncbi:MAG: ferritin family protein [Deltaproteobacteria bacterium]|jgi:rubrerythrin|nr:ferritin family protein [Deltaproteobacteria bacterium]